MIRKVLPIILCVLLLSTTAWAADTTYYMRSDGTAASISAAIGPCTSQSATMDEGDFDTSGNWSLSDSANDIDPGDTVIMCDDGGDFDAQIDFHGSGTAGNRITLMAESGATPTVKGSFVGLDIDPNLSYITVDGITFDSVNGYVRIHDSSYITVQNCTFTNSLGSGTTGGLKVVNSTYGKFLNNTFTNNDVDKPGDTLTFMDAADYNLIEGNSFYNADHSLITFRCAEYNVVRNNTFDNPSQKIAEVIDCEGVGSDNPFRLDSAAHNLFEDNEFIRTNSDSDDHSFNAIQHCGQYTIVRNNIFRDCPAGGVNYQNYSDECTYDYGNKLYNNTFYGGDCHAIICGGTGDGTHYGIEIKNNLVYQWGGSGDLYGGSSSPPPYCYTPALGVQTRIYDTTPLVVCTLTDNDITTSDPLFVDEVGNDFHLTPGSLAIDSGGFVTTAVCGVSECSGTSITVVDASYFYDGFGIDGEVGDLIQLEGQTATARISSINYTTNVITLEQSLTWTNGLGVHLEYFGSAPDTGAYELGEPGQLLIK